jgi:hypothetical protein
MSWGWGNERLQTAQLKPRTGKTKRTVGQQIGLPPEVDVDVDFVEAHHEVVPGERTRKRRRGKKKKKKNVRGCE